MELTQSDACISRRVRANELAESIKGKYRHEFVPSKRKRKKRKERSTLRATQCANNYTKSSRCVWMEFESSRTAFHFSPTRDICRSVTAFHRECSKLKSPVNRQLTVKVIINYYLTAPLNIHRVEYLIPGVTSQLSVSFPLYNVSPRRGEYFKRWSAICPANIIKERLCLPRFSFRFHYNTMHGVHCSSSSTAVVSY